MAREDENNQSSSTAVATAFTRDEDHLAILSQDGTVKVWNTAGGSLVADWKEPDRNSGAVYTCISCSFVGKKRKKEEGRTFLVALGTSAGDVLATHVPSGERKWINSTCHSSGMAALFFANKGRTLYTAGTDGLVFELSSETGECLGKFKASKKAITSLTLSHDEKLLAITSDKVRVFTLEDKKEILKFSSDLGLVQHIFISNDGKYAVSSLLGKKQLQVWSCDQESGRNVANAILSMQSPPVILECKNCEEGVVVLSVSEKGIAYLWHLKGVAQDGATPTRILVKSGEGNVGQQKTNKKNHIPIIAAKLCDYGKGAKASVFVAYGSLVNLQFQKVEVIDYGEDIYLAIDDEISVREAKTNLQENKDPQESMHEMGVDSDTNEPTIADKLANLDLLVDDKANSTADQERPLSSMPPSADSVHLLVKQALHADDHALLLDCLYTRDQKVITKSTSLLNPADVLKLLNALISMTQSRGAVLVCAIPWLKSLLNQHASSIASQESSLLILNSLFQLIESRISTYGSTLELSTCIDFLFAGIPDDEDNEDNTLPAIVYEDKDTDEEETGDVMDTDEDSEEVGGIIDAHDSDGSEVMSD